MGIEFIEEGHYREGQIEYFSIWTFKRKFNIQPNNNSTNYEDAKQMVCPNRKWLPFNQSDRFKSGWHYESQCLFNFYRNI